MPSSRNKSRLERTQEKAAQRELFRYTALTIGVIAFILLVGIPFVIPRLTQFVDDTTGRGGSLSNGDTTPPPPPHLRDVPRYTKDNSLEVKGTTEPSAKVFVIVNGRDKELKADVQGNFSIKIELQAEEDNEVYAFSEDEAGNRSGDSNRYTVTVDKEAPEIEIVKPQDGAIQFGQENAVQIEGKTEANVRVTINDRIAIVNREGKFNSRFTLSEGGNNFEIKVVDQAGNETKKTLTVSYSP